MKQLMAFWTEENSGDLIKPFYGNSCCLSDEVQRPNEVATERFRGCLLSKQPSLAALSSRVSTSRISPGKWRKTSFFVKSVGLHPQMFFVSMYQCLVESSEGLVTFDETSTSMAKPRQLMPTGRTSRFSN